MSFNWSTMDWEQQAAGSTLVRKAETSAANATGAQSVHPFIDAFDRRRQPTSRELFRELKNTIWACVNLNASVSASFPPMAYLKTSPGLPIPKSVDYSELPASLRYAVKEYPWWQTVTKASKDQFMLPTHPINDLFVRGNYFQYGYNLWHLTHQYMEIFGVAYWWVVSDQLTGLPMEVRVLPTHWVEPKWENFQEQDPWEAMRPTYYKVTLQSGNGRHTQLELGPDEIVAFRRPDPNNPMNGGRSPMHACFELATLQSEYLAHRQALYANRARPDAVVSPNGEFINEDELARLQKQWNQSYRRGGAGQVHFASIPLNVEVLGFAETQTQLLSEHGVTKEDILNLMGVPVSFYTRETNMANLQASEKLHRSGTIQPIIYSRDETITRELCRRYDPSGMLFVSSEDPVPEDENAKIQRQQMDLQTGKRSINQVLAEDGLPPVEWGDMPILPTYMAPLDIYMVWEVRREIALARNDPASALESARTRDRVEDVNNPDKPMADYSHASVHGPEQKAGERRKKEAKKAREKEANSSKE